jgi:3D-(3,5/4)-trihydroxycyclohexane-1,2-dione acylhydrolase (decyclizing)
MTPPAARTVETLTVAQAIVRYMIAEGVEYVLGILGHGNVVLGEAIQEACARGTIRYISVKNEQNAVHIAAAYARMTGRPLAVTTSIGPGATNLVTGAAAARVNRLPVLLLPGEIFADGTGPVLQQVEGSLDTSANECLKPVARYFTRVTRPEQLRRKLREAFDAMLTPGDMGPAVMCLPMDVQAMAHPFEMDLLLAPRDRDAGRIRPDGSKFVDAARWIEEARRPFLVAGGGAYYSRAWEVLGDLAEMAAIPVATTQSGMGLLLDDHPLSVNGIGPCGSQAANRLARKADLVIGVGTRYSDFTTSSDTQFAREARFININISPFDVAKQNALKLWGDARLTLSALIDALRDARFAPAGTGTGSAYRSATPWFKEVARAREAWHRERQRWLEMEGDPLPQSRAIQIVNDVLARDGTITAAAGSLPGDLQRLWRAHDRGRQGYYCEYGYSTMGFEIAGAIGVKLALPARHVCALVGDMSFLMAPQEIVTAVQLRLPITVVVFDNHGGQSIRGLQRRGGFADFSMEYRIQGSEEFLPLDFVKIAEGLGAAGVRARTAYELERALEKGRALKDRPLVIHLTVDRDNMMGGYDTWWDVPRPESWAKGEGRSQLEAYRKQKAAQVVR